MQGILLEVRDIGQAITNAAHHFQVYRPDALAAPALDRALGDLPAFGQLGLGQIGISVMTTPWLMLRDCSKAGFVKSPGGYRVSSP